MTTHTNPVQAALVLGHLQSRPLTPLEALHSYGCFRLAARIHELRALGHHIHTEIVHGDNGKRFASYHLLQGEPTPLDTRAPC